MRELLLIIAAVLLIPVLVSAQSTTKAINGRSTGVTMAHIGYTVSYDVMTKCPVFVEWTLTREHLSIDVVSKMDEFVPDTSSRRFLQSGAQVLQGKWYAMGWMMPNRPIQGHFNDYAVSVDEIERLTGLDF